MTSIGSGGGARETAASGASFVREPGGMLGMKWSALHDAAHAVATIARARPVTPAPEVRDFPAAICDAGGWRRRLAEQGIEDLNAILEPGLAALLSAAARGVDPRAAALALWSEFVAARDALVALVPDNHAESLRPA